MEKRWLLFATAAIIAAGLYPPWEEKADIPYRLHFERSVGYSFLWSPPGSSVAEDYPGMTSISVDGQRLLIEWFLIGLAAAVGTLAGQRGCLGPQDPATTTDERGEGVARFPASPAAGEAPAPPNRTDDPFSGLSVEERRKFLLEEMPEMMKSGATKSGPNSLFELIDNAGLQDDKPDTGEESGKHFLEISPETRQKEQQRWEAELNRQRELRRQKVDDANRKPN